MSRRPQLSPAQDSARRAGAKYQKWRKALARRDKWSLAAIKEEAELLRAEVARRVAAGLVTICPAPGWAA